jgi:hypothetical protein
MNLPSDCAHYQPEILDHFRQGGTNLNPAAKSHLARCEGCIAAVFDLLDDAIGEDLPLALDLTALPAEARSAIEHGRKVMAREFGITFVPENGQPVTPADSRETTRTLASPGE